MNYKSHNALGEKLGKFGQGYTSHKTKEPNKLSLQPSAHFFPHLSPFHPDPCQNFVLRVQNYISHNTPGRRGV